MQRAKKKNGPKRIPQKNSTTAGQRIKAQQGKAGRGRIPKRATGGAGGTASPFILKPCTQIFNDLRVGTLQGRDKTLSDPAIQLNAIRDVYPIVSKLPGYRESKKLSADTSPADVLHDLLVKFEKLTKSDQWSLENDAGKYTLHSQEEYGDTGAIWIQVNFLARINRSHVKLHGLLVYGLVLVNRWNKINLFHDWVKTKPQQGHHGMVYEYLLEREEWFIDQAHEPEEDEEEPQFNEEHYKYEQCLEYYGPKGVPASYINLFNKANASLRRWKTELERFKPGDDIENACYPFLKAMLALAQTRTSIVEYCQEPYEQAELTPMFFYQVIWCWDDDDLMWLTHADNIDSWAQNGVSPFCWKSDFTKPEQKAKTIEFLDKVIKFMNAGNEMSELMEKLTKGIQEQTPLPLTNKPSKKHGKLIDIFV